VERAIWGRFMHAQRRKVAVLAVVLVVGIGLQLYAPYLIKGYMDDARTGTVLQVLIWMGVAYLAVTVTRLVADVLETYWSEQIGWTATNTLRQELLLHALRLPVHWHKSHAPGEMIERIDGDVTLLNNFFSKFALQLIGQMLLVAGIVGVLLVEHVGVGLAFLAYVLVAFAVLHRVKNIGVAHWAVARQVHAELYGMLGERLTGLEDVRGNGGEHETLLRFHRLSQALLQVERRAYVAGRALWPTTLLLFALGYALVFGLGGTLFAEGTITFGTLYLMFSYIEILRRPFDRITEQLQDLQKAAASIRRIQELLTVEVEPDPVAAERPNAPTLPVGALAVEYRDVSFGYGAEHLLHNVTFTLAPGRKLGLLGRTGSGKSTLTHLLFRLYEPGAGTVELGGIPLQELALSDLRGRIGLVNQDVRLFGASLRDNVTMFDRSIPDERVQDALVSVGLGDWLLTLPAGLETELAGDGGGVSSGQAQLLALARVFLQDPGLVILDEASSRLDPATERQVEQAIAKLLAGRTAILIAHRLQTVQEADDILVLERGRIVEHGERAALQRDPHSRYAELLRTGMELEVAR